MIDITPREHEALMQLAEARAENERLRDIIARVEAVSDCRTARECETLCFRADAALHAEGRKIRAERAKKETR